MSKTTRPKSKKILFLSVFSVLIGFFLLLEMVSYLSLTSEEKRLPPSRLLSVNQNKYIQEFSLTTGCLFTDAVIGHPVLGYVYRQRDYMSLRCQRMTRVNNIGMRFDRDLPLVKNKKEFALLVVGGSVAEQFANYQRKDEPYFFEELLNRSIKLPSGKKFRVYNGSVGGWAMPNQLNMIQMYGDRIDGVIALDGYNEAAPIARGERLEKVLPDVYLLATSPKNSFVHIYLKVLRRLQENLANTFLKHSYFFNVSYKIMVAVLNGTILSPEVLNEFSEGNTEKIQLPIMERRQWAMNSLRRYLIQFHESGRLQGIKTAHFLQPSRMYGKVLTENEKKAKEYGITEVYLQMDTLYSDLGKKYPIRSLTHIFENERGEIYSDHIHFIRGERDYSKGNEMVAMAIVQDLKKLWKF